MTVDRCLSSKLRAAHRAFALTPAWPVRPCTQTDRQTDTQTDITPKLVKTCSGPLKTCRSIKNRKSKIRTKPILSSIYSIEESKKMTLYRVKNN